MWTHMYIRDFLLAAHLYDILSQFKLIDVGTHARVEWMKKQEKPPATFYYGTFSMFFFSLLRSICFFLFYHKFNGYKMVMITCV